MSWHASEQLLDRYAHDRVDVVTAASLEAHLLACDPCRRTLAEVGAASLEESIERAWSDIVDTLDQPKLSLVERLLRRVGVADGDAKVIATAPSLRLSWLGAVALAVAFAVWAARNGPRDPIVFLTLAPFVPLAGVAVAFGPIADPMHETILASPISATRILAMRSLAVGVISATILLPATLILAVSHPIAAAWIAPALAVVSLALCLAP
ncbi:MAG: zf-HC2 domain-containing protein, partial [Acidimicrobiia bacterium]|nr:zf-HC2 domain-containing protein [Acidimicrobiia bacterium]